MREQLEKLVALQTVDLKIREMERLREEIPKRINSMEEALKQEEEKVLSVRAETEKLQKDRRKKEKDLEEEIDRVKKTEARVFEIKTNKEYQAVLKEVESAKKLNREREEEILGLLERLEELGKKLSQEEKELEVQKKQFQQQMQELKKKANSFDEEMAKEIRQRADREKEISADLLSRYRMLLEKRGGVAVAVGVNGVCQACHMNIRPQLYIELQKQESLILCPNCSRILFWENGSDKGKET